MKKLSIVIVSYNTREVTAKCFQRIKKNFQKYPLDYEVVVVDNDSTDGSQQLLKDKARQWPNLKVVLSEKNLGYGKANNLGVANSEGEYILYLNSDALMGEVDFGDLFALMDDRPEIGVMTIKVVLPDHEIDPASHRGFPTVWRSFCYYAKLEKIFGKLPFLNRLFGGYHLTHKNLRTIHEIDSPTGAFFLTRKKILEKIGGFDKEFFMYGEDLDLSFRIKELGYIIIYYPLYEVLHLKYISGLKNNDQKVRIRTQNHFYESMKIFYRKHYEKKNLFLVNWLVYSFIDIKRKLTK